MKSQILVPNIILTDNPELLKKFNSVKSSYTSFQRFWDDIKNNFSSNDFILLTSENKSFTSFNFEIGVAKPGGEGGYTCNIEFVETGEVFERRLLESKLQQVKNSNNTNSINLRTFYIAFGVGDDLRYWSNFSACPFLRAQIFQNFNQPKTIKITFKVLSLDQDLTDLIMASDLNVDSIVNLDINNVTYEGMMAPPSFAGDKIKKEHPKKADLVDYFFGANSFDYFLKQVTNNFLRAIFGQVANVFFVCGDLKQLLFNKITLPTYTSEKISPKIFDLVVKNILKAETESDMANILSLSKFGGITRVLETLPHVARDYLNFDLVIPTYELEEMREGITFQGKLTLQQDDADQLTFEEKQKKIVEFLNEIRDGLQRLTGVECVLLKESDTAVINSFCDLFPKDLQDSLPFNKTLPLILFGQKNIIRSIVYGEKYKNIQFLNEEIKDYYRKSLKMYNLYGSHQDTKDLPVEGYPDFPIFRFNVSNSNVLSINAENNNFYNIFLQSSFTKPVSYKSAYSLSLENEIFSTIFGRDKSKNQSENLPAVASELFELLDISKSVKLSKTFSNFVKKAQDMKEEVFSKLFDSDQMIPYFEFITSLYGEDVSFDGKDVKTIVNEKLNDPTFGSLYETKQTLLSEKDNDLSKKITSFLKSNYSLSDRDLRNYLFITYAILGLLSDTEDFNTGGYNKLEALKLTLKRSGETKESALDDALVYADMFNSINSYIFTVEIKTLPFFGISSQYWIGKPCILYAKRSKLIGKGYEDELDDYLTGAYRIIRMNHEINTTTCESTFVLQKISSSIGDVSRYDKEEK